MSDLFNIKILIRGGGDLGSGAALKLHNSGLKTAVVDLPQPLSIRREVSCSTALMRNSIAIEGVRARRVTEPPDFKGDFIPVFTINDDFLPLTQFDVIIDAALKSGERRITSRGEAPFTVGLGPGFQAPEDIDCVIETGRGHNLGHVIWSGCAEDHTGRPGPIEGATVERVLRAPSEGKFKPLKQIGDIVQKNELIGWVAGRELRAGIHGVIRGLSAEGLHLKKGEKLCDIDPRGIRRHVFTVSDRSRCVAGGVLEALLTWVSGKAPSGE